MLAFSIKRVLFSCACLIYAFAGLDFSAYAEMSPPSPQLQEAIRFFKSIKESNQNPLIINFAKETLNRLESTTQSPAKDKEVVVSLLSQADNSLAIPVMLNKKSLGTFLIDTGASYTVLTPRLAKKMNITVTAETPRIQIVTANGITSVPLVTIESVMIGGIEVKNVQAVIQPLGNNDVLLAGLLGMNFFQNMNLAIKEGQLILSVRTP